MTAAFKPGARVSVPWGFDADREATVVEVWGDPESPSQLRIELIPMDDDEEVGTLLIGPDVVSLRP